MGHSCSDVREDDMRWKKRTDFDVDHRLFSNLVEANF